MAMLREEHWEPSWGHSGEWPTGFKEVARVDESESYEIDQTVILFNADTKEWGLATATGCSCWDGDWSIEYYASFEDLRDSLDILNPEADKRMHNPTLVGATAILFEAKQKIDSGEIWE